MNPLANVKRVDCALLPPSRRTLQMKVRRAQYVTILWTNAATASPGDGLSPTEYGWSVNDNLLQPIWFQGPAVPDTLFTNSTTVEVDSDSDETIITGSEAQCDLEALSLDELSDSDDEPWSEDSDSDQEEDMDYT